MTLKYKENDSIYFYYSRWCYKDKKNITTKERGDIIEFIEYNDENWGTLNVRVIPENKEIWDKYGGLWITQNYIISKIELC